MEDFFELLVSGVASGCLYALMALSFLLVMRPTGIVNFAVGQVAMLGGFVAVALMTTILLPWPELSFVPGLIAVLAIMALLGAAIERIAVRPLVERGAPHLASMLSLLGVLIFLLEVGARFGGTEALPTEPPFGFRRIEFGPLAGTPQSFFTIALTLVIFAGGWLFFERTLWGRAFESVAIDRQASQLMGVNLRLVTIAAFASSAVVAGLVGVLISGSTGAFYQIGMALTVQGFTALVIGGVGRVDGALIGGILLGLLEAFVMRYLPVPSALALAVPLVVLLVFLVARPTGLLKNKGGHH